MWIKYKTDFSVARRGFHAFYNSKTTLGNTINVSFSHFAMETHRSCNFDFLELRNGDSRDSPLIGKYCGTTLPAPITSSGEHLWLNFRSDYSVANNGFRLEYINNGRECIWSITVATGMAVELNISDFDLETHTQCRFDVLEVFNGPDDQSPRLVQICHTQTKPQLITTTGNQMFVRFKSDASVNGRGFSATYRSIAGGCGGNFSTPNGVILSKNYPNDYPPNTVCTWLITVEPQKVVVLTFLNFDVETHSTCRYDYVAVYDGSDINAPMLIKHCGNSLPVPSIYRSSGNQMYIRMRTDSSVTGCGGILNAEEDGVITSPNYPENYDRASNCSWLITADHSDDKVTLTFTDINIEPHGTCDHDSVTVYNGDDAGAPVIGSYCGNTVPTPITSYGSSIAERGSFLSPSYPDNYPLDTECVWTFSIAPGNRIMISFSLFNIEEHETCNSDYVEFREGDVNGRLIGRFCGTNTPGNITAINGLWMKFRSDSENTGIGFMGQYSTRSTGQIASPGYPQQYPHNADYTWTITVTVGMMIRITFVTLDMESGYNTNCYYDYIRVNKFRDGGLVDSPILRSLCGYSLPDPFISTTNQLMVQFHSDLSSSGQGFLFRWEETNEYPPSTTPTPESTTPVPGCGGNFGAVATTQVVTSPGYPFGYSNNLDCTWTLHSLPGFRIWINISDIDIETHGTCLYDRLVIFDSNSGGFYQSMLGTYCGRVPNSEPLLSTSNSLMFKFITDYSLNRTGFSLQYKAGIDRSSNYIPIIHSTIQLTLIVPGLSWFQLAGQYKSHLTPPLLLLLLNGGTPDAPPLSVGSEGRFCGNQAPAVMNTSSNMLFVRFISDGINDGPNTGFRLRFSEIQVTCGGHIALTNEISSGFFMSPGFPGNYPHNVDCTWIITASALHRIQIDFVEGFNIESHASCRYDYIELRDGGTVNSNLIGRFCGTSLPSTSKSTGNVLFARFRTDNSLSRTGYDTKVIESCIKIHLLFLLAECGGYIAGQSGEIQSPNYPQNYGNNEDCEWSIRAPTGHYLTFVFEAFNLVHSSNCSVNDIDVLQIRDFNSTVCGGDLTTDSGTLNSPNYPGQYAHSRQCTWKIKVQPGRRVTLNFNDLDIESHSRCLFDFVAVYNGIFDNSPLIKRLCGQYTDTMPEAIESSGNVMKVVFRTDGSRSGRGFRASYSSLESARDENGVLVDHYCGNTTTLPDPVYTASPQLWIRFKTDISIVDRGFLLYYYFSDCGGILTESEGVITSPNYPGFYNHTYVCVWNINAPEGYRIRVTCGYDFVDILNGGYPSSPSIGKKCGSQLPSAFLSQSNQLRVIFSSDYTIHEQGFRLIYTFESEVGYHVTLTFNPPFDLEAHDTCDYDYVEVFNSFLLSISLLKSNGCGALYTEDSGVIVSPGHPDYYTNNLLCNYTIKVDPQKFIVLEFSKNIFHIEGPVGTCRYDSISAWAGSDTSGRFLGRFCGLIPPQAISALGTMFLQFKTDATRVYRGFSAYYRASECGGNYTTPYGVIRTPTHPTQYHHNANCTWLITVQENRPHSTCAFDYVDIIDGLDASSPLIGRYCGLKMPSTIRTTGNSMMVNFVSDSSVAYGGFTATYITTYGPRQGCGGVLNGTSGRFSSVDGDGDGLYENNLNCKWIIFVGDNKLVRLTIEDMEIEEAACRFDYIKVHDGISEDDPLLGKFCGNNPPPVIRSSSNVLFVQFYTDVFFFSFVKYLALCGGTFTATEDPQTITSPGYPNPFGQTVRCRWTIDAPLSNQTVRVTVSNLNLISNQQCEAEYLEFRDSPMGILGKSVHYCGSTIPQPFDSMGQTLQINYAVTASSGSQGFSLKYEIANCNRTYTDWSGQIFSPGWPRHYPVNANCEISISGPTGTFISLYFNTFSIEPHPQCQYDFLQVGTYCDNYLPDPIFATGNSVWMNFITDQSVTRDGFDITYTATTQGVGCGGNITGINGSLTSPGYPGNYTGSQTCKWLVTVPARRVVTATFTNMNLIGTENCDRHYVQVFNGNSESSPQFGQYCGVETPAPLRASGNSILIKFVSDGVGSAPGFRLCDTKKFKQFIKYFSIYILNTLIIIIKFFKKPKKKRKHLMKKMEKLNFVYDN
ncbi:hypothetical protein KUTeg_014919 [Tegillarca granosa]|uniref:CUB domain-containing protein n=1 Tax=Tegillarca granosa TaxID=220873 RepID=A0ABQ9ETA0_TEGGR|nr:hypothetical protein KUTeg_014919 [Tegillarca granosa]